jgi:hypothetical protein
MGDFFRKLLCSLLEIDHLPTIPLTSFRIVADFKGLLTCNTNFVPYYRICEICRSLVYLCCTTEFCVVQNKIRVSCKYPLIDFQIRNQDSRVL